MSRDWQALLTFWFGHLTDGTADDQHRQQWFTVNAEFDAICAARFASWLEPEALAEAQAWVNTPRGCLAYIILTDQLPRNIHRGTAMAFEWDSYARNAALAGIQKGLDLDLGWDERAFFYMPFEHAEGLLDQHLAVGLFTALRDVSPKATRNTTGGYLRFAQQHRDIILKFGRFPHRNVVLGRESSNEELAFVSDSDGFGQTTDSA